MGYINVAVFLLTALGLIEPVNGYALVSIDTAVPTHAVRKTYCKKLQILTFVVINDPSVVDEVLNQR